MEIEELTSLFDCPEWKQISLLYDDITERNSGQILPEDETSTAYKIAA